METNGYNLSRKWFDFCFENPERINTNHTALYMFIIDRRNRFGKKEKFGLPADFTMEALQIKSRKTYYKIFNDLIEMGFIEIIEKSKNQNTANIIKLACVKNTPADTPALDLANIQAPTPADTPAGEHNKTIKQDNNKINNNISPKKKEKKIHTKDGVLTKEELTADAEKYLKGWNEYLNRRYEITEDYINVFINVRKKYSKEQIKNGVINYIDKVKLQNWTKEEKEKYELHIIRFFSDKTKGLPAYL